MITFAWIASVIIVAFFLYLLLWWLEGRRMDDELHDFELEDWIFNLRNEWEEEGRKE